LALERQRGITIKSAVVSFVIDDLTVNLIDTPGHPDFIAEVEQVLRVLDGAVLVVSAVEGVQAQTRVLMRALQRLRIPTLIFVNKIDRAGAQYERVLQSISEKLAPAIVPMGSADGLGTREAVFTPFTSLRRRLAVSFRETTTICIERSTGTGAAVESLRKAPNTFLATVGLRIQPAAAGADVRRRRGGVHLRPLPTSQRHRPDPTAIEPRLAQSQGIPAARHAASQRTPGGPVIVTALPPAAAPITPMGSAHRTRTTTGAAKSR
jgi:small GTP-binding protein